MSPPPYREKDAKVEGRDPLKTAPKETMTTFKNLMGRLLKVPMSEVAEQQRMYDAAKTKEPLDLTGRKKRPKMKALQFLDEHPRDDRPTRRKA